MLRAAWSLRRLGLALLLAVGAVALYMVGGGRLHSRHDVLASSAATITSPINGSTLTGGSVSFTIAPGATATSFILWVGSTAGGSDLLATSVFGGTTAGAAVPTNSWPVYARLWSFDTTTTSWLAADTSYTAAAPATGLATLSSPLAGAVLAGASQSVTWTGGSGGTGFMLMAGSTLEGHDYYISTFPSGTSSAMVTGLPTDGRPVYFTLYTQIGYYQGVDYVLTAAGNGANRPGAVTLAAPVAGQSNLTTTPTLMWNAPTGAIPGTTQYTVRLYQGSATAMTLGGPLTATTALLLQVPSFQLAAGQVWSWTVVACNGSVCSSTSEGLPIGSWQNFTVAPTQTGTGPGTVAQSAPADGTQSTGTAPTLSWTAPPGAIYGVTQYSVVLHDAAGGGGNALTPLPATISASQPVPAQVALQSSHTYSWNVYGCTYLNCSPLASTWWSFSTGTASAGSPGVVSPSSPADHAVNTGTTPTLSWGAPTGAISGTTQYTVSLWDPSPAPSGTLLANLSPTTSLSIAVPYGAGLANGHSYHWNVNACNGNSCGGLASHWFAFSTAPPPDAVTLVGPANNATNQPRNLVLTWTPGNNAITGVTLYYLSLWDPYAPPTGHRLGDVPVPCSESCSSSGQVPLSEGLLYSQSYQWNVYSCNGEACSAYAPAWWSFTTQNQPPITLSGAGATSVRNGDLSGSALVGVPNWSGDGTFSQGPNYSFMANFTSLNTSPLSLSFSSNSTDTFRIGYQIPTSGTLQVAYNGYNVFTDSTGSGTWVKGYFSIPASLGASGQLSVTASPNGTLAYLARTDTPASSAGPFLGLGADPRFPKAVGATAGFGVDVTTGAYTATPTDLALPGVGGTLSLTRAYNGAAVTTSVSSNSTVTGGPLGPLWTHNWEYSFAALDASTLALRIPGGQEFTFSGSGNGSFSPGAGVDATFVQDTTSHYTLTTSGQVRYGFALTNNTWLLTTITDRNLNVTTLSYDTNTPPRLTRVTDPGGRYLSFGYGGTLPDQLTSVSDSAGRTVHYAFDPTTGLLTSVTDVLGGVTQYQYSAGLLTKITDPLNHLVLTNYYGTGTTVLTQTDAAGGVITFQYATPGAGATRVLDQRSKATTYYFDTSLRITDATDAYGNRISGAYDSDNNKALLENQLGGATASTYDAQGNVLSVTDGWNYTSYFTYDPKNNRLSSTDPLNHLSLYTYDSRGDLLTSTDRLNQTTTWTFNSLGQLASLQDPRGYTTTYGYNSTGDRTTVTDPLNHTTTTAYDTAGRPTSVTDALNHSASSTYNGGGEALTTSASPSTGVTLTSTNTYDVAGHLKTTTDPLNHTTTYAYDNRGLTTTITDANTPAGVTTYGYDAAWNRTSVKDAKNQTTSYTFDNDERQATVTDALSHVLYNYTYDAAGRVATRTDGKNQVTTYSYTLRSQLDHITYPGSVTVQYQYDALGNRTSMVDPTGTTSYQHDAGNRLTSVTSPGNKTVGYNYDADGNRANLTYPNGKQVSYSYDNADRLTSVIDYLTSVNGVTTQYAYDNANRLTTTTLPATNGTNHVASSYVYDNANRLTSVSHQLGTTVLASASYVLDANSNRTSKTTPAGTENYTLDVLNRLTQVTYPDTTTTGYGYDAVGNRTSMTTAAGMTSYTYDVADRLTSVTPPGQGATNYGYDANDNTTARGADTFSWDVENRLTSATVAGAATTAIYNGNGLRTSRTSGGNTASFIWDASAISMLLDDGTQYVYGLSLVARVTPSGTYYYLDDGLGSTMAVVSSSGTVVQSYTYDVYGAVKTSPGTQATEFQFAGEQTDPSGLQFLRARYYDPTTGRFLSPDPDPRSVLDPSMRPPYAYAGDNPPSGVDPSGLFTIKLRIGSVQTVFPITFGHVSINIHDRSGCDHQTDVVTRWGGYPSHFAFPGIEGGRLSVEENDGGANGADFAGPLDPEVTIYSNDDPKNGIFPAADAPSDMFPDGALQTFAAIAANLQQYIIDHNIDYRILDGPNSNSVAYTMLLAAGFNMKDIHLPDWSKLLMHYLYPGWGQVVYYIPDGNR